MKIQSFCKLVMGMLAGLLTLGTVVQAATVTAPSVKLTEVEWHGTGCYRIEMPMGTVYFEKDKGVSGFKSFIDPEGNDWVASYLKPGPNGNFRGFPNSIGNFGHAGRNSGSTTIIVDGKTEGDHVILESSNDKFTFQYWFFPDHIAIKVLKSEGDYHFLLECVAGGTADANDYFVTADGKKHIPTEEGEFDDFTPEWIYLGDPKSKHLLFFAKSPEDNAPNENHRQIRKGNVHNMDLYSFGRTGKDNDPKYQTYGMSGNEHICIIGFTSAERTHQEMSTMIEEFLAAPFREKTVKTDGRPRVIIMSDFPPLDVAPVKASYAPLEKRSDPDDVQSMVRFLLYTNEFDVEGLIASAATKAYIANKQNILDILNLYDQVDENLRKHDPRYPTADQLRWVTWQGRDKTYGKNGVKNLGKGMDTEASDAIIRVVDKPDDRPVFVCVWGGPYEVAQAIWNVKSTRTPDELKRFLSKLRIYLIGRQDDTAQWLLDTFPDLFIIVSEKTYGGIMCHSAGSDTSLADLEWINKNIRHGHGLLGVVYPYTTSLDPKRSGVKEGDTPSFLYLVSSVRGLNDPDKPDQESWGGQFIQPDPAKNHWYDGPGAQSVYKWRAEIQEDFARRADWMLP